MFTSQNLHKCGTNEGLMVKLQQANGVVNTKSTVVKLIENWETINDLIEPLKRYASIILVFDPIFGHILHGILGVVTREQVSGYFQAERSQPSPALCGDHSRAFWGRANECIGHLTGKILSLRFNLREALHALDDLERANVKMRCLEAPSHLSLPARERIQKNRWTRSFPRSAMISTSLRAASIRIARVSTSAKDARSLATRSSTTPRNNHRDLFVLGKRR